MTPQEIWSSFVVSRFQKDLDLVKWRVNTIKDRELKKKSLNRKEIVENIHFALVIGAPAPSKLKILQLTRAKILDYSKTVLNSSQFRPNCPDFLNNLNLEFLVSYNKFSGYDLQITCKKF